MDQLATWVVSTFMGKLRKYPTYRHAIHTQSILTITSNVVYGKATGNTPDGRRQGRAVRAGREPDARAGQPRHSRLRRLGREDPVSRRGGRHFADRRSLVPEGLGRVADDRVTNLTGILDAFFGSTGYHMNVNVLNRDTLLDAMDHPEKYPNLTIRVSGYAVNFVRLTREQQMDVINRTFHGAPPVSDAGHHRADAAGGEEPVRAARQPRPECSGIGRSKRARDRRHGIPALVHDRICRRWPRRARRRMDNRLHVALSLLPQPRHLDDDERHSGHGRESDRGAEEIPRTACKVMSGGVTVSGGEPLMQHRFVVKLLTAAKAMGIHTTIETNGYYGDRLTRCRTWTRSIW